MSPVYLAVRQHSIGRVHGILSPMGVVLLNHLVSHSAGSVDAESIGFASTNTMTVSEFGELRSSLREVGATYTLAKKTLVRKAIKDALDIEIDLSKFEGQVGFVCSNEDAVAGLGKVNELVKKSKGEKINWVASIFE